MRTEDLNHPGIVKIAKTLEEELAEKIKEREQQIVETTLGHARLQGTDLLRAKQHLGPRKFTPWVRANLGFSRQTAYTYMKVAGKWDAICQGGLQMGSLQDVLRKLFGEGQAKKNSKLGSAPETEPPNSHQLEEASNESVPGQKIEAPSYSQPVEDNELGQHPLTPGQEEQEYLAKKTREMGTSEDENKTVKNAPTKYRRNHSQEDGEGAPTDSKRMLVIPIIDPRIHDYLQGMIDELLEAFADQGLYPRMHPEEIRDVLKNEGTLARIILQLVKFQVDRERGFSGTQKRGSQELKRKS